MALLTLWAIFSDAPVVVTKVCTAVFCEAVNGMAGACRVGGARLGRWIGMRG
jgi:hypothetical protein